MIMMRLNNTNFYFRISNHLSPSTVNKSMLDKALYSNDFKVKYLPYDWAHNDKKK